MVVFACGGGKKHGGPQEKRCVGGRGDIKMGYKGRREWHCVRDFPLTLTGSEFHTALPFSPVVGVST